MKIKRKQYNYNNKYKIYPVYKRLKDNNNLIKILIDKCKHK